MITEKECTIVEAVRALKEANAARFDFDVAKIIESARLRQESSGHRIIRQVESGSLEVPGIAHHTTGSSDS
jgi:hypothetical protein